MEGHGKAVQIAVEGQGKAVKIAGKAVEGHGKAVQTAAEGQGKAVKGQGEAVKGQGEAAGGQGKAVEGQGKGMGPHRGLEVDGLQTDLVNVLRAVDRGRAAPLIARVDDLARATAVNMLRTCCDSVKRMWECGCEQAVRMLCLASHCVGGVSIGRGARASVDWLNGM